MAENPQRSQPDWPRLYEIAESQDGFFALSQAHECGYSSQLLRYHCRTTKFERVRRGIYRLSQFPAAEREDLMVLWLWSNRLGVFSHGTALSLHQLSDLLPERVHLTLPESQKSRQRAVPRGLVLHYDELPDSETAWHGNVPVTSPRRTLTDCVAASMSPELVEQALDQAVARGLLDVASITDIARGIEAIKKG